MREEQSPDSVTQSDLVERYLQRRLGEADEAAFEEYLLAHPEAALAVEDAERLQRGLRSWESEGGALAKRGLPESEAEVSLPPPAPEIRRFAPRYLATRFLAPLAALAAMLLVAVLLPPSAKRRESPEISASPAVPATMVRLSPLRGDSGEGGPVLTLGDPGELLAIALEKRPGVPGPYRVTLLQAGQQVWSQEGLAADSEGPLVLAIEARLLPPGQVELLAESLASPPQEVGRFPFAVEKTAGER